MFQITKVFDPKVNSLVYRYYDQTFLIDKEVSHIVTDYDGTIWAFFIEPIFDWNELIWDYDEYDPREYKRYIKLGKCEFIGNASKSMISYV